jgi:hypothetical protein
MDDLRMHARKEETQENFERKRYAAPIVGNEIRLVSAGVSPTDTR